MRACWVVSSGGGVGRTSCLPAVSDSPASDSRRVCQAALRCPGGMVSSRWAARSAGIVVKPPNRRWRQRLPVTACGSMSTGSSSHRKALSGQIQLASSPPLSSQCLRKAASLEWHFLTSGCAQASRHSARAATIRLIASINPPSSGPSWRAPPAMPTICWRRSWEAYMISRVFSGTTLPAIGACSRRWPRPSISKRRCGELFHSS